MSSKISNLSAVTSLLGTDITNVVRSPFAAGDDRKITMTNFAASMAALGGMPTGSGAASRFAGWTGASAITGTAKGLYDSATGQYAFGDLATLSPLVNPLLAGTVSSVALNAFTLTDGTTPTLAAAGVLDYVILNPSSNPTAIMAATFTYVEVPSTCSKDFSTVFGNIGFVNFAGTGNVSDQLVVLNYQIDADVSNTKTIGGIAGVNLSVTDSGAGTVTSYTGFVSHYQHGAESTMTTLLSNVSNISFGVDGGSSAACVITGAAHYFAGSPSREGSATIGTVYGLQIQQQKVTGVTTGYGVFQESTADINNFVGNVGFGAATAPAESLHVIAGNGRFDENIVFGATSGTTSIATASIAGVARALHFDIPVAAGGAANAALDYQFKVDGTLQAGLLSETDGSGGARDAVWKIPAASADYGAAWASVSLPAPASLTDGAMIVLYNSNAGVLASRIYFYTNSAWKYAALL